MRRVRMGLTVCLLLGAAAALLLLPETAAAAAGTAVELCLSTLLPSLFPYFVLTELWVLLGAAGTLGRRAGRWMGPLFHLPGAAAPALLLGAIGGYPVGAQAVGRLYDQGALTRTEAEQTLLFCNNAGPAFVLGVVGGGLFGSPGLGAALLAIHLGSALLLGMLLRPEGRPRNSQARSDAPPVPFQTALPLAVRQAGSSFLSVCLLVALVSLGSALLTALVPAPAAQSSLFALALGALELAGGTVRLAALSWPGPWVFAAAAGLLGFGGLCVQMQTQAILSRFGLSGRTFRRGKLLQGLLSAALALILAPLLPLPAVCWTGGPAALPAGLPWMAGAAALVLAWIFRPHAKIPSGNPGENRL